VRAVANYKSRERELDFAESRRRSQRPANRISTKCR
jgi:hypothetical protein